MKNHRDLSFSSFLRAGGPTDVGILAAIYRKLVESKRPESLEPLAPRYLQYEKAPEQHGLIST